MSQVRKARVRPINVKGRAARRGLNVMVRGEGKQWFAFIYRDGETPANPPQFERRKDAWAWLADQVDGVSL